MKTGLVLEGGGLRGMYTSGIMDVFMENGITFDGVIGVSAGAVYGSSYISGQKGRNIRYSLANLKNKEYMSVRNLIKTGDFIGADYCYRKIPDELDKFDYDAFRENPTDFYVVCTDIETGKPVYLKCDDMKKDMDKMRASASLPIISRVVHVDGMKLLDGGTGDSIPVHQFRRMGYKKCVVILTRPAGYVKEQDPTIKLLAAKYKKYPEYVKRLGMRYHYYNKTLRLLEKMEMEGKVLIIRPSHLIEMSRTEKNPKTIKAMYALGVYDGENMLDRVKAFLA